MLEPVPGEPPAPPPFRIAVSQRLGALAEIVLCSGFPTQIVLIAVLTALGMQMRTPDGGLSPAFIFTLSLADTGLVVWFVLFFLKAHRERAVGVLVGWRPVWREALVGVGLVPLVFGAVLLILAVILTLAPELHNVPRNPLEDMLQNRQDALVFALVVMIAGGVREEVQRAFILHRFDRYLGGGAVGVIVFSALFGLGHLEQGYDAAIATAVLGAIWGVVYLSRRSIVAPMVSHALFNLAQLAKYVSLR